MKAFHHCPVTRRVSRCESGGRAREEGKGKRCAASLLSPSRDPSHARPQFLELLARLLHLATEIEVPEEEAGSIRLVSDASYSKTLVYHRVSWFLGLFPRNEADHREP